MIRDHREAQLIHVRRRIRQRHGLALSRADVEWLVRSVREEWPGAQMLAPARGGREAWEVVLYGRRVLPVIYDPVTKMFATSLTWRDMGRLVARHKKRGPDALALVEQQVRALESIAEALDHLVNASGRTGP